MLDLNWGTILGWVFAAIAGVWVLVREVIPVILKSKLGADKSKLQAALQDQTDRRDYQQELLRQQLESNQEQAQRLIDVLVANEDFIRQIIYEKLDNIDTNLRSQNVSIKDIKKEITVLLEEVKEGWDKLSKVNNNEV
jgi:cysteinyl-tRNA synthetase